MKGRAIIRARERMQSSSTVGCQHNWIEVARGETTPRLHLARVRGTQVRDIGGRSGGGRSGRAHRAPRLSVPREQRGEGVGERGALERRLLYFQRGGIDRH